MMDIRLTKKELAEISGYTYRWLHNIDKGLPKEEKLFVAGEDGKYDLATFVQRWAAYHASGRSAADGKLTLEEAKTMHEQVKMQKSQMEVARLRGELVDINEVRRLWVGVAKTVSQNLMRLPGALAQQVTGLTDQEIVSGILEKEIREALTEISKTPVPNGEEPGTEDELEDEQEE